MTTQTNERPPVLYLSHGAPPLADDATWTRQLREWGASIPKPRDILVISAHWEDAPTTISAFEHKVPLLRDFWGFPKRYYEQQYDHPLAPTLAHDVAKALATPDIPLHVDPNRGLDHGAYVPLAEMFPKADVPVLQLSMPTLDPQKLFQLGQRLAPLRENGTLLVMSGFTTHNLSWFNPSAPADAPAPTPSREFDAWAAEMMAAGDVDSLLDFAHRAPAAMVAHPRTEHWAPLFMALGAADASGGIQTSTAIDGFWFGLSKRSWNVG